MKNIDKILEIYKTKIGQNLGYSDWLIELFLDNLIGPQIRFQILKKCFKGPIKIV